jgi:carnitine 3-dehydrogenase
MAEAARPAVALLGGGVIGGGWMARFLLNGWDVRLYDPAPGAPRAVGEVLANARRAYARLTHVPLRPEGVVTQVATPEEAVAGAAFVQESAPEREELKRALLAAASRAAAADTVIASSTSGLRPTRLQAGMTAPERLCVGHPFNPVYLLPLVELCGGEATAPATLERAADVYRSVGARSTGSWPTACSRRCGARRCGWWPTTSRPWRRSTMPSVSAPGCAGR